MPVDVRITPQSSHDPEQTATRFEAALTAKGMTVFAKIDHAAGAASVGLTLRPTLLIVFGNPKGGTPLMQAAQTSGIDLPLRALVWQDASGATWLSYDDPAWIATRHGLHPGAEATVRAMSDALQAFAAAATRPG